MSYKLKIFCFLFSVFCFLPSAFAKSILIYMDSAQSNHLKAYGVAYYALEKGMKVEWLLNYRGGSFLMKQSQKIARLCKIRGVSYSVIDESNVGSIYRTIEESNMERLSLEVAPRVAVYVPHHTCPWDDAVRLVLEYAEIHYTTLWDQEVLSNALENYDWLHLHHEDFTGQYGKFYASFRNARWYQEQVRINKKMARKLGFKKVWQLKHRTAEKMQEYVKNGGFLFAMCSATETIDIAFASGNIDIVPQQIDGDPVTPNCQQKLDYSKTFAFENFKADLNAYRYNHSDIDVTREADIRGPNVYFTLFNFSAKYDPIPTLLCQNHTTEIKEFLGQCTGFRRDFIKENVVIMGDVRGTKEVKYIYGDYGKGFFTFYGGHDPEDYKHMVGESPTELKFFKNSPGYRLILNNILFPAAKSKRLKT